MISALITAGSSNSDPLQQALGSSSKALIEIGGKPMIRHVVDALVGTGQLGRLVIVGLPDALPDLVPSPIVAEFLPDHHSLAANTLAGVNRLRDERRIILCAADIPLITSEIVSGFLGECAPLDADVYYPVVERAIMEERFPGSGRSYVRLHGGQFAGGDLAVLNPHVVAENRELLAKLTQARKNAWDLVQEFGISLIVRFLTRTLSLAQVERKASQVLNCRCRAIQTRYAEIGMDADKMPQFRMIQAEIEHAGS